MSYSKIVCDCCLLKQIIANLKRNLSVKLIIYIFIDF